MDAWGVYPVELRQEGNTLAGVFPYGSQATMASRGRVRKERFEARAFRYAVEDSTRDVHLLVGHSYDAPLASKLSGSLTLDDSDDALSFRAALPAENDRPSWMVDALKGIVLGLMTGISPGFNVPPTSAVANAERLLPEPGNPGVFIRSIAAAVLFELSVVTRAAYREASVQLREESGLYVPRDYQELRRWL